MAACGVVRRSTAVFAALFALALVAAPSASAVKYYDSFFGGTSVVPEVGGKFGTGNSGIGDVAVNSPSITSDGSAQSGWVYAVDRGNNRIQAFDQNKVFRFAVGRDVIQPGGVGEQGVIGNERQSVSLPLAFGIFAPSSGTFKLAFNGPETGPIAFNATAATVQAELEGLSTIDPGDITVTGGPGPSVAWTVDFAGQFVGSNVPQIVGTNIDLITAAGPGSVSVTTPIDGGASPAPERCTVGSQCQAGKTGVLGGEFNGVQGIDVDQATGHLFVVERTPNRRVQEFAADGTFIRAFGWDVTASGPGNTGGFETCNAAAGDVCKASGAAGAAQGQMGTNTNYHGIAVAPPSAPNAGKVYVADPANRRVLPYTVPASPSGAVVAEPSFGVTNGSTQVSIGSNSSQFAVNQPQHVGTDVNGVVYASNFLGGASSSGYLNRFDTAAGTFLSRIEGGSGGVLGLGAVSSVDRDDSSGHLLVGRPAALGLMELDVSDKPALVGAEDLVVSHAAGLGVVSNGVAANSATGVYYLSTSSSASGTGAGERIVVLDDTGIEPPPTVTLLPASDVGSTTATLNATVNPNGPVGFTTTAQFEVSKDGVQWTKVGPVHAVGDGNSPVVLPPQPATGLEANSTYRMRVVTARTPAAGVQVSAELVFGTDVVAPEATTLAAQHRTATSADLLGRVNPGNLSTSYRFEYGFTAAYGTSIPVPDASAGSGGSDVTVGQTASGLQPGRTYHYRLVATNSQGTTLGADRVVTTRATAVAPAQERAFEMVTPADKVLRRYGDYDRVAATDPDFARFVGGQVSREGKLLVTLFGGGIDPQAGAGFAPGYTQELRERTPEGWVTGGALSAAPPVVTPSSAALFGTSGSSGDFSVFVVRAAGWSPWATGHVGSFRVIGDEGGPLGVGMYPTLDPSFLLGPVSPLAGSAMFGERADLAVSWLTDATQGERMRDVLPADGGLAPKQLSPAQTSGHALFTNGPPDWVPQDLINECSGSAAEGTATELPARVGTGVSSDLLGARSCGEESPTSVRGARMGAGRVAEASTGTGVLTGTAITSMSQDGRRFFFHSPDTAAAATTPSVCAAGTGASTDCPPQLFVRQYDDQGEATVRWISRPEPGLFGTQEIGQMGRGVAFEGASTDGRVVYFRTNAPLTADDPNGGTSIVTGSASANSWDLYRYELPADLNADPAGGVLTRVTAGPDPNTSPADPNTNAPVAGSGQPSGSSVRFMSDDGSKVYFVTAGEIPGAIGNPPVGGVTVPGGSATDATQRNLYLYDADETGPDAYRFVARIPFSTIGLDACASHDRIADGKAIKRRGLGAALWRPAVGESNCVTGTSSGDAIMLQTTGRLTSDDVDQALDVYVYDADAEELVRVSAPPAGSAPYRCITATQTDAPATEYCNGDTGIESREGLNLASEKEVFGPVGDRHANVAEDSQGRLEAVFFESRLPLAGEDVNSDRMDVYEWRPGGRPELVSPGTSGDSAFFVGNSRDGRDVFFWTEQRISAWEIDNGDGDVYSARVGGGFPDPQPPVVCGVLAGECQAAQGSAPVGAAEPGSLAQRVDGNAVSRSRGTLTLAKLSARARARAARSGTLAIRVGATAAGRVAIRASAKLGRRTRRVASRSLTFAKPTAKTVELRLSRKARAALRQGRRLRVAIVVRQDGARPRSMAVALKRGATR